MIRRLILAVTVISILTPGSAVPTTSVAQLESGARRTDSSAHTEDIEPRAYLPFVRYDYNWAKLSDWTPFGLQETHVGDLHVGPEAGWVWAVGYDGVFRSTDHGRSWEPVDTAGYEPFQLATDPPDGDGPIFAATSWGEVLSSTTGVTWTLDSELETYTTYLGWTDGELYAGTSGDPYQVHRRTAAAAWQPIGGALPSRVYDLAVFRSQLYAATGGGLYRLDDETWNRVAVFDEDLEQQANAILASSLGEWVEVPATTTSTADYNVHAILVYADKIFVGTSSSRGLYRSADGVTWTACDVGITGPYTLTVVELVASADGKLFAATRNDGVFVSDDGGRRWMALDGGLPHSVSGYGILLDNVAADALVVARDQDDLITLGASFNNTGAWLTTVTDDTWLVPPAPEPPPKAVLVVGPVDPPDHITTKAYISYAERLAAIMEANGVHVVRIYRPHSTWENVRAAIGGASIVVYYGHGFGLGDIPPDPTELYGSLNGFCLVDPTDSAGARLGTQDMLVTTNQLAQNAIGFFFCCYCAGGSASDPTPVSEALARRRIEAYGSTMLRMGGGGYFASINSESFLREFFSHPDKTIGEIYRSVQGDPEHVYPHVLWPEESVWFDGNQQGGWSEAFVGDPTLTAREVLGR